MNLTHLFDHSFRTRAGEPALEFGGRTLDFGALDKRVARMTRLLLSKGFETGDRLCVYLPNCLEFLELFFACTRLGVVFVPINILYRDREIGHILRDAEPKLVVRDAGALAGEAESMPADRITVPLDGDAPAAIVYTSGTTGTSKGAVLTHNNFVSNAVNLLACWRITEADRLLLPLPLFHVHGLGNGVCCWLASGCRMRLLERFEYERAAAEFLDFRPTLFFGVPTIYVRMLGFDPESAARAGRAMRLFVSGSAPLPPHVLEDFRRLFGHTILERYGMTETLMNLSNPHEGERRAGTVGFPLPGVSVKLVDGELYLKGPNLFAGYWRRESPLVDGWFPTGDLAERSEDGYYTLRGRRSDLIISGGFNVYPREIEEFLLEQPEISEAAVVGVADERKGEVPVAYVAIRAEFVDEEMTERCRAALASFKVPKRFVKVERLPRNALGKVQKHLLAT